MKSTIDVILERGYWISQIVLMAVALAAAMAAFFQLRAYKLFELLKLLEAADFRSSRGVVLREIYQRRNEDWWLDPINGERWIAAASTVCAFYDILARMIEYDWSERIWPSYGRFFRRNWARSIITNHDALERYLAYRRQAYATSYGAFSEMVQAAKAEAGPMAPPN